MGDELAIAAATPEPLTDEERAGFLAYVREHQDCSVREAADAVGVKRKQIRHLKQHDDEFAADYREARGYGDETIRAELRRRALEGVEEEVFGTLPGKGAGTGVVGIRRVFSDRLLGMMAKAHLPEYRETLELSGPNGAPVPVEVNGGRVTGISDVFELARAVGAGLRDGLSTRPAGDALPAAPPVLPDPPVG